MYNMKYPNLFAPLKLGNVVLRNRIISAPQGFLHLDAESLPTQAAAAFYEEKARGGAAVVTIGEGYVDSVHGIDIPKGIHLDTDDCIGGLRFWRTPLRSMGRLRPWNFSTPECTLPSPM